MKKIEKIVLENGLCIYLINDNTKHTVVANLIVKFGGIDTKFKLNNKIYNIKNGVAHFLEHTVLESSKYGDLMEIFGSQGIRSNGLTSINRTQFYIDTVDNIEKNLSLLIEGIHTPIFDEQIIENIRKPILEEKRKSLDNKFSNLYNANVSTYISNKNFRSILGDFKDIKSISKKDLEIAFKTFYRPSNEILVIGGNFDKNNILNIIKKAYSNINFAEDLLTKITPKNNDKVNKKEIVLKDNTNIGRTILTFKINISQFNSYDKVILDLYIYSFLKMNFGITSKLNEKLLINNIIIGNLFFSTTTIDNYYIIKLEANTNKKNEFTNILIKYINRKEFVYDKELFELYKKGYIIDLIVRNDSIYSMIDPLIENILSFGYENVDKVSDIEKTSFKEFKDRINNLNFENYSITEMKPL